MAEATLEGGEMIMTPADEWAVGVEVFVAGEDGEPIYREDGKVLKGPNYFKPNIKEILEK